MAGGSREQGDGVGKQLGFAVLSTDWCGLLSFWGVETFWGEHG